MTFKKYLPTLVCGFGAAVLSIIPETKDLSCCLIVPGASTISILLDKKINHINETVIIKKALKFGLLTGLFSTLFITTFDILITFITKTNDLVKNLPQIEMIINQINIEPFFAYYLKQVKLSSREIQSTGFSLTYLAIILMNGFIINSIFGMIGGALGMNLANRKAREENTDL